jgi:hypothetical protein
MQVRKKLKAVNSDAAKTRLVNKLDKIREAGEVTPNKAIETESNEVGKESRPTG